MGSRRHYCCRVSAVVFSLLVLFACSSPSRGATYYVDPAGSDANAGTSAASAWKTIAKVNASAFNPGDTISFKRGATWRETLKPSAGGSASGPITYTAYGSGASPVISGSDVLAGPWTYSPAAQAYSAPAATRPNNVYVDGGPGWGLTSVASSAAMPKGSWNWASGALYVRTADDSNPAAHVIEIAVRDYGVHVVDLSHLIVDSLAVQRTGGYGIFFYADTSPSQSTGNVIRRCVVSQTGTGTVDDGRYYNAIYVSRASAPTIRDNTISYAGGHGNAVNSQYADDAQLIGNTADHFNHHGMDTKNSANVVIRGNVTHDANEANGIYQEYCTNAAIHNNIVYNLTASVPGRGSGIQLDKGTTGAKVYNNSIYNTFTGIYLIESATVENNAVSGATHSSLQIGSAGIIDYNDWGASPTIYWNGTQYTFAQWQRLGGHSHDLAADPMWVAPAAGNFTLRIGSPCIDTGLDRGVPFIGLGADIGAVESF